MNMCLLTCCVISCVCILPATAQTKAKAISYSVDVYLEMYDPVYYQHTESEEVMSHFEIDAYYTDERVKTIVRKMSSPIDYSIDLMPLLYDIKSREQYHIDHDNRRIMSANGSAVSLVATKNRRKILGFKCREYYSADQSGMHISFWIAEKPGDNICPIGNFSLKGVVLELIASNGVHCTATDITEGEVEENFFELPEGYIRQAVSEGEL